MRNTAANRPGKARSTPQNQARSGSNDTMDGSTDYEPASLRRSGRTRKSPRHVTPQPEISSGTETRGRGKSSEDQPLKKRLRVPQKRIEDYDDEYLNSPMNETELSEWTGWCEIESDPVSVFAF